MFNKKFNVFLITLVFMLSLSAVGAADTNSSDDVIASDAAEEPPSLGVDEISASESLSANESANGVLLDNASDSVAIDYSNYLVSTKSSYIKAKDVSKPYGSTFFFKAIFYDAHGKPLKKANVDFIIKNKTYTSKTNLKGVAKIAVGLSPGEYDVLMIHPDGFEATKKITIKSSIKASKLEKHYLSSKNYKATFYDKKGNVLANKNVKFHIKGKYFTKKTNSKGVATLGIISKPGTYKITCINPSTGEKKSKKIKVLHTLSAGKMTVFSDTPSTFKVTLYKDEKLVKNAKVYVKIKGNQILAKTNSKGVASFNFKLAKGTYSFKSTEYYTGDSITTKVTVKKATIKAYDMYAHENVASKFKATLLDKNGKKLANTNMEITLDGKTHTLKTNSKGVATLSFKLSQGTYSVTCKDLNNGYSLTKKITVLKNNSGKFYSEYGVSEDGKTILAIGRASASGEMSKYGYSFHKTEFLRECPYCGSHELYWSIFWAGSETADYGVFPATGHKEGGSAEGHIFCAHCDCDWSVYGNNHGTGGDLKIVSPTVSSSKEEAYLLKSGNYVNL